MEKVAEWNGMTASHGFDVEVFHDAKTGMFIAQLDTYSPPLLSQHIPGRPVPMMQHDDREEIKHEDLAQLRELTKKQIASHCGKIQEFSEK